MIVVVIDVAAIATTAITDSRDHRDNFTPGRHARDEARRQVVSPSHAAPPPLIAV
jgi:hypothetical protein